MFRSPFKICLTFLMFPLQYNLLKNTMKSWTFQMYRPKHQPHMKWLQMMLKFQQSEKVSLSLNLYSLILENFLKQLWRNHCLPDWEKGSTEIGISHHVKLDANFNEPSPGNLHLNMYCIFFNGFLQLCTCVFSAQIFAYWIVQMCISTMFFMYYGVANTDHLQQSHNHTRIIQNKSLYIYFIPTTKPHPSFLSMHCTGLLSWP